MGDVVEDIVAEPDEPQTSFIQTISNSFLLIHLFVKSYGWYLLLLGVSAYYLWRKREGARTNGPRTEKEMEEWQAKEEQRLRAVQKLQERYVQDAKVREEERKKIEEEKQKQKLADREKLLKAGAGGGEGHRLGGVNNGASSSKSLRPEYNPLMGDTGDSHRVCFRRPGGGSGG